MDRILLIDGMNAIWRASITFSPQKPHILCEECTHAIQAPHCVCGGYWIDDQCEKVPSEEFVFVYNFFRSLRPLVELFSPEKCFFVLEGHPQFRYDLFAEYKANRIIKEASKQETKDKVFQSKDEIVRLLSLFPVTVCRAVNYECDDVISSLCENMKEESLTVVSNDTDYIQILQRGYKDCRIYNPIRKEFMEAPQYPYVAWKSLNGDKSDNIPALLKPKKAIDTVSSPEMFKKFLSLEENRANFSINRQLIEFRAVPEEEIIIQEGIKDFDSVREEFDKMKFASITNDKSWAKYVKTFECIKY